MTTEKNAPRKRSKATSGVVLTHPSLADIVEKELVRELFSSPYWRSCLLNVDGFPEDPVVLQALPLNNANDFFGDVDVLVCAPSRPECAVAIEVKRVKVRGDRINRLSDLPDGARQANQLARVGFWKAYLYVLVAVDHREQNRLEENGGNASDGVIGSKLRGIIEQAVPARVVLPEVGLMYFDFLQSTDRPPVTIDVFGGHLVRQAQPQAQPVLLTRWVSEILGSEL